MKKLIITLITLFALASYGLIQQYRGIKPVNEPLPSISTFLPS